MRRIALGIGAVSMTYPYIHPTLPLDLHVYLVGGRAVLHGADLYSPQVSVHGYGFTYPPFAALIFACLASVPGYVAVGLTIVSFFAALLLVLSRASPGLVLRAADSWTSTLQVTVALAAQPTWATLHDGQINMTLAALVLFDLARPAAVAGQGFLTGVCAAVKLTPVVFVVYLVVTRRWRAAGNAVAGLTTVTCAAWVILPVDSRRFWFHDVCQTSRVGATGRVSNQSLLGLFARELPDTPAHVCWVLTAPVALAAGLLIARRVEVRGNVVVAIALVGTTGCLVSPISWTHHWVWFVPLLCGIYDTPFWALRCCRFAVYGVCGVFLVGATRWAALPLGGPVSPAADLFVLSGLLTLGGFGWATRKSLDRSATSSWD